MRKILKELIICIPIIVCIVLLSNAKIYAGNKYIEIEEISKEYKINGKSKVYLVKEKDTFDLFFCKRNKNGKYIKLSNQKVMFIEKKIGDIVFFRTETEYLASVELNRKKAIVYKKTKNYVRFNGFFDKKNFFSKNHKMYSINKRGENYKKVHNSDFASVTKNGIYYECEYLIIDGKKKYIENYNDIHIYKDENIEDYRWTVYRKNLDGKNKEVVFDSRAFDGNRDIYDGRSVYISRANDDNEIELYYINLDLEEIEPILLMKIKAKDVAYKSYDIDEIESPIYFLKIKNNILFAQIGRYIYKIKPNGDKERFLKLRKKNNFVVSFKITKNYYKIEYSTYTLDGPEYISEDVIYYYDKNGDYVKKKKVKRDHVIE